MDGVDLGPPHPDLGRVTLEPTVMPGRHGAEHDPGDGLLRPRRAHRAGNAPEELVHRLQAAVSGRIRVLSDRLVPCEIAPDHPLVRAALASRPGSRVIGSSGVSDLVFFRGSPASRSGRARTERSHTPDEFVLESEILEAAAFYERLVRESGLGSRQGW